MKILSIKLVGNIRLLNKGTRSIHFTPNESLQLIIGQNGHGKSTLLEELSPLPATPADYNKGGSKFIVLEHNTHTYELLSDFTKGARHSFLKDGNELNPGGTITVQKTLVEQEFGYTADLHALLLGKIKITQLTTKARREWFVKLCETDVSYATKVYGSLMQSARNAVGALKHAQSKLATEVTRLLDPEQHEELKNKAHALMDESFRLSSAKIPGVQFDQRDRNEFEEIQTRIKQLGARLLGINEHFGPDVTVESLQRAHESDKIRLQELEQHAVSLKREYDTVHSLVDQLVEAGGDTTESLLVELDELERSHSKIKTTVKYDRLEDVEIAIANAQSALDPLHDLLMVMPVNKDALEYTRTLMGEYTERKSSLQTTIDRLTNQITHAEHRCQEMKRADSVSCPECRHTWIIGFSELAYQQQQDVISRNTKEIAALQSQLQVVTEWLEKATEWRECFVRYTQLTNTYPRLREFWDSLVTDYKLYNAPKSLVGALDRWLAELYKVREKTSIESRMELIRTALEKRRMLASDSTETLVIRQSKLEQDIHAADAAISAMRNAARATKVRLDTAIEVETLRQQLQRLVDATSELLIKRTTVQQNDDLEHHGNALREQAGMLSSRLQQSTAVIQIVEHLTKSISELETDIELYEILQEELSPTSGLIAETLIGFINTFTSQMNGVLSKIWTTPLSILPCDVSDGELDYQFPIRTLDDTNIVSDISNGSTGEKEVIDFAFRLIAMLYLGIEHYPLLLDEVGASFHELNRNALFGYIKLLVECRRVSQVFVISHFAQTHGSLTHADVNIIDPTGIMVTPDANKYFVIQ